jgi:hypothetical protein
MAVKFVFKDSVPFLVCVLLKASNSAWLDTNSVYMAQVVFKHPYTVEATANEGENRPLETHLQCEVAHQLVGKGKQ